MTDKTNAKEVRAIVVLPDTKERFDQVLDQMKKFARRRADVTHDTLVAAALDALEKQNVESESK
jgi:hypothetical protein